MTTGRMKTLAAMALSVVSLLAASGAQATLSYRLNNQAVYDSDANLTWLRDANANGQMNWSTAMAWADGLSIGGVDDWRLPGGTIMTNGYNQTASEMGNMFYNVLGGTPFFPFNNATNYAFFQNIQYGGYWSGVEFFPGEIAGHFDFSDGYQGRSGESSGLFAWAVRSGDVGGNPVPAPGTLALLGAGLLGWAGVKRSRHRVGAVIG